MEKTPLQEFNDWLAVKITKGVATMWCAYAFALIALIALPQVINDSFASGTFHPLSIVTWISQCFIQLVMLSIIMVGQQVIAQSHERSHEAGKVHSKKIDAIMKHLGIENE